MRRFNIRIWENLDIWYNHYLSAKFIYDNTIHSISFKSIYQLSYLSRRFDKPAWKYKNGSCIWFLDDKYHRVRKPAKVYSDGSVSYYENGEFVK